jgi:hypothetical protein
VLLMMGLSSLLQPPPSAASPILTPATDERDAS